MSSPNREAVPRSDTPQRDTVHFYGPWDGGREAPFMLRVMAEVEALDESGKTQEGYALEELLGQPWGLVKQLTTQGPYFFGSCRRFPDFVFRGTSAEELADSFSSRIR